jgi:hypothetical protein
MTLVAGGKETEMNDDEKRINIEDLPKAAEELTEEEAKNVEGGHKESAGHLILPGSNVRTSSNTIGGARADDPADPRMRDGSV